MGGYRFFKMSSMLVEKLSLAQLLKTDDLILNILPQKKGYFMKHVEYEIRSTKYKSQVWLVVPI